MIRCLHYGKETGSWVVLLAAKLCIYCGGNVGPIGQGEHVIPARMEATETIRSVCTSCNSGILSGLDRAVMTHSFLAFALHRHSPRSLSLTWDIDYNANKLLVEALPTPTFSSWVSWPQLILDNGRPEIRASYDDLLAIGKRKYRNFFLTHLCNAYRAHKNKTTKRPKGIFFEPVRLIPDGCRLPPRVYTPHRALDITAKETFVCRYASPADRNLMLAHLDTLTPRTPFARTQQYWGSERAQLGVSGDAIRVIRGLTKWGVNLLEYACDHTHLRSGLFRRTIQFIMTGASYIEPCRLLARNGFLQHDTLPKLKCPARHHRCRLVYCGPMSKWVVFFAFFGGDIKARVEFQGENDECWNMCDVLIPLHSSAWRLRRYQRVVDWNPCVEWKDVDLVIPGLPQSHNKQSNIEVRLIRTARAPAT